MNHIRAQFLVGAVLHTISSHALAESVPAYLAQRDVTIHLQSQNTSSTCEWLSDMAQAMIIQDFEGTLFPRVECKDGGWNSTEYTLNAKFGSYAASEDEQAPGTADWIPFDHVYGKETYDCPERSAIVKALLIQGFDTRNLTIEDECASKGSIRVYGERLGPHR